MHGHAKLTAKPPLVLVHGSSQRLPQEYVQTGSWGCISGCWQVRARSKPVGADGPWAPLGNQLPQFVPQPNSVGCTTPLETNTCHESPVCRALCRAPPRPASRPVQPPLGYLGRSAAAAVLQRGGFPALALPGGWGGAGHLGQMCGAAWAWERGQQGWQGLGL